MEHRVDTTAIAEAILSAPGWARVGITAPTSIMREDAARELARCITDQIERTPPSGRSGQERLAL